jgi:uncharacterized membrane protein
MFAMKYLVLVLSVLLGLLMLVGGVSKFVMTGQPEGMPPQVVLFFLAMKKTGYLFQLLGAVELVGGLLVLVPRFRLLGAVVLAPVTVNILLFNASLTPEQLPVGVFVFGANLFLLWYERHKWLPLLA